MTREILFIQGAGEGAHDDWDDKLVDSLERALGPGHVVRYPRMPDEANPQYAAWKLALQAVMKGLPDGTILIGHSVGGTMLLHALAESPPPFQPGALILLAPPFIGTGGWPSDELPARSAFALPKDMPVLLFHGTVDETVPVSHAGLHAKSMPLARVVTLTGRDHQLNDDLRDVAEAILSL